MKFVSEPASPPQLVEVPEEGRAKAKERREVGEGDDCWGVTRKIRMIPLTRERKFLTRSSTRLER
jgi:hypothetical protein